MSVEYKRFASASSYSSVQKAWQGFDSYVTTDKVASDSRRTPPANPEMFKRCSGIADVFFVLQGKILARLKSLLRGISCTGKKKDPGVINFQAKLPKWWRCVCGKMRKSVAEVVRVGAEAREEAVNVDGRGGYRVQAPLKHSYLSS